MGNVPTPTQKPQQKGSKEDSKGTQYIGIQEAFKRSIQVLLASFVSGGLSRAKEPGDPCEHY